MKLLHNLSIKNKLIVIILIVTIFVIVIGFSVIIKTHITDIRRELIEQNRVTAQFLGRNCVSGLLFEDNKDIEDYLKELQYVPNIEMAQVYDLKGELFAKYTKTNEIFKLDTSNIKTKQAYNEHFLEIIEPIQSEDIGYGYFYLRINTEFLKKRINDYLTTMLFLSIGLIIISFILAFFLQKIISGPILRLVEISRKISNEGDYSIRVSKLGNDETGDLFNGFNNMLEQFQRREMEKEKAIEELQESEEQYKKMSQSAFDAIIMVDERGIIQFWNKSAEKIFGYKIDEIYGNHVNKLLVSPDDFDRFKIGTINENLSDEIIGEYIQLPVIRKDNTKFPVELSISPIWLKNKWYGVAIIKDISKRKKTEQELINAKEKAEESDRLKSAFLSNMSHEIRTPLNSIIGFAELLTATSQYESKKNKYLNYITSSGKSLLNLINDIIDVSKIEAGHMKIKKSDCKINQIFNEIFAYYTDLKDNMHKKFDLKINIGTKEEDFEINTDPYRFRQILSNLLNNAFKFTEEGFVEFGYKIKGINEIEFYVSDTGIGIPEDKFDVIFDRFGQVEDNQNRNQSGTGLGLAISKKLTDLLGGKMWVHSLVGNGSTFYFSLPLKNDIQIPKKEKESGILSKTNLKGIYNWNDKIILIAEDEVINYMFLEEALSPTHCKIIWAKDGKETVEICKTNNKIDLILMDIKMPELDGYKAASEIKRFRPALPIIAQTAYALAGEKEKCFEARCDDFITKPIRPNKLLSVISNFLDK